LIASSAVAEGEKSNPAVEHIFQVVESLEKAIPVQTESLQKITQEKFERDPNAFWPYGDSLISVKPGAGFFGSISACVPRKGMPKVFPGGKVFLDIKPDTPVEISQVKKHFGKFSDIDTHPCTDMPLSQEPTDYIYKRPWGSLIFECGPRSHLVRQICINAEH
jgi:hypothetical protein